MNRSLLGFLIGFIQEMSNYKRNTKLECEYLIQIFVPSISYDGQSFEFQTWQRIGTLPNFSTEVYKNDIF